MLACYDYLYMFPTLFAVVSCILVSASNRSVSPLDHGEAANHGLLDVFNLSNALAKVYSGTSSQKEAIEAVLPSRQACWRRMSGGASTRIVLYCPGEQLLRGSEKWVMRLVLVSRSSDKHAGVLPNVQINRYGIVAMIPKVELKYNRY
jgi:hypothetical protein